MMYRIETGGLLHPHLSREWLLTNGLGAFASSTVIGCNTRRYHGLLCAAITPPVGRMMMLNRIGEIVLLDGNHEHPCELSINQFSDGVLHPRGERHLVRFEVDDIARFIYEIDGVRIVKEVQLLWMRNVVGIRYTVTPDRPRRVELQLLPFVSMRDFHHCRRGTTHFGIRSGERRVSVSDGHVTLHMQADAGRYVDRPDWWFGHVYPIEAERGLDCMEDLYTPGRFVLDCDGQASITVWASLEEMAFPDWQAERRRRADAIAATYTASPRRSSAVIQKLLRAANDFVVYRRTPTGEDGTTILAGYPWFADWGRDTFIALPGLLLATGRLEQARQVLTVFAQYVSEGMIPNRFDDYDNTPHYNTVDASLWFIHAAFEYRRISGDASTFEKVLLPACQAIHEGYRRGTRFGIHMDESDGLIAQGDQDTQLTWMDAKCNGVAFTPRQGKPVEINALWYNALRLLGQDALADTVATSFRKAFWISPFRGLADVVRDGQRDNSIRPNQIFAVSLPHSPLEPDQQSAVVEVVRRELLTPFGLRTLSRDHPNYHGVFTGPPFERDRAYHNGTVWPWLIGAFLEAYLKVNRRSGQAIEQARAWLTPLIEHLDEGCIGQVAEVYCGDPPHVPGGCCAQAWSVAEVLRLAMELEM